MPKESPRFWDRIARRYSKRPVSDQVAYEQTLERTRAHLRPEDDVLELGCGTGTTALLLADSVERVTATDISPNMLDIAREKAAAQRARNVAFARATPFDMDFPAGRFDVVLAFNLLHLIDDWSLAFERIREVIRPGGLFISKTVCFGEHRPILKPMFSALHFVGLVPYAEFLSPALIERRMEAAGFEVVERGDYPPSPPSRFIVAQS
jgi:ubiquinone/menaquinone biosynthesis C-methylase UbiE